jgi:MFS family permease
VTTVDIARKAESSGAGVVLLTLAAGQFLMTLDSSVMNVSIATVAEDVGTTVTGIQGAITAYTLVMAALMIMGAKISAMIGRKRLMFFFQYLVHPPRHSVGATSP